MPSLCLSAFHQPIMDAAEGGIQEIPQMMENMERKFSKALFDVFPPHTKVLVR